VGLIASIWRLFLECLRNRRFCSPISDVNQCVSMTNVALQYGCEFESDDTWYSISSVPTSLFQLCSVKDTETHGPLLPAVPGHLLAAGFEMEDRNNIGQTPLLHAANIGQRRCLDVMNRLVSLGANIHALDEEGRGALHQALDFGRGLMEGYHRIFMNTALLLRPKAMSGCKVEYYYDSDALLVDSDNVSIYPLGVNRTAAYLHFSKYNDLDDADSDIDYSSGLGSKIWDPCGYGDDDDYVYIGDYDIDDFTIGKGIEGVEAGLPNSSQKTRVRFKLLTLLEAGCDPNLVDKKGASPTDYARRDHLWPQWEWALTQSGYIYDKDKELWIKDISFSDIVEFTAAE
jgi:ankyrin repeat protein